MTHSETSGADVAHAATAAWSFLFENIDVEGAGPESLQEFLRACRRNRNDGNDDDDDVYVGADAEVGFRTVQTIDAMYRSHASKECVDVGYMSS